MILGTRMNMDKSGLTRSFVHHFDLFTTDY
jgi:hypothetical protein